MVSGRSSGCGGSLDELFMMLLYGAVPTIASISEGQYRQVAFSMDASYCHVHWLHMAMAMKRNGREESTGGQENKR